MNDIQDDMQAAVQAAGGTAFYQSDDDGERAEVIDPAWNMSGKLPPEEVLRMMREGALRADPEYSDRGPVDLGDVLIVVCAVVIFWAAVIIFFAKWFA